ncbi:MAG TPA: lysophospholipid acyltransferase family protein [Desulfomonilia bacterium]|nr:lysophospholipid acyltransferase family protein [Desulfomonilia bacterium]
MSFFTKTGNILHLNARYWAKFSLWCANTPVEVKGRENIPDGPAVYMPNHVSHFDVFAILGYLEVQFRWTVKKELFRIPLLGLGMKRAGYILVDRGNHEEAIRSMKLAAHKIKSGTSIVIFPEGTRSCDGMLQYPFKKGGFHLAIQAGVPIVPITVSGTREILPKHGIRIKPGRITLTIGEPIQPSVHDVALLMEEVYKSIKLGYTI